RPPAPPLLPYTTLFRSLARDTAHPAEQLRAVEVVVIRNHMAAHCEDTRSECPDVKIMHRADARHLSQVLSQAHDVDMGRRAFQQDRKSTRLNSSHRTIS